MKQHCLKSHILIALAFAGSAFSVESSVSAQAANQQYINYSSGFSGAAGLKLNGSATLQGSAIQLTDAKQN